MRQRLPDRRESDRFQMEIDGVHYTLNYSRFADCGLAEIFIDAATIGDPLNILARDMALVTSLALQHGCSADDIRASLERQSDGLAAGPLGKILDAIEAAP